MALEDFRISDAGGTGNADFDAFDAVVTYNSNLNQYLVVWSADDTDVAGIVDFESEIFGQIIEFINPIPSDVPTMGQWSFFLFSLIVLSIGIVGWNNISKVKDIT